MSQEKQQPPKKLVVIQRRRAAAGLAAIAFVFLSMLAAWALTPLGDWVDPWVVVRGLRAFAGSPSGPLVLGACYVIAGLIAFPNTILCLATILALGPMVGLLYAMAYSLLAALVGYGAGRWLSARPLRQLRIKSIDRLNAYLERGGTAEVLLLRLLPLAPFAAVNFMSGAARIRFLPYTTGTFLGLLPLNLGFAIFGRQIRRAISDPHPVEFAVLGSMVLIAIFLLWRFWPSRE